MSYVEKSLDPAKPADGLGGEKAVGPIEKLKGLYRDTAKEDVAQLEVEIGKALGDVSTWSVVRGEMRAVAHNVMGQGASFGYPLMSEIGRSLSILLKSVDAPDAYSLKLISAHVQALRIVMSQDIQGDGGEEGAAITARLKGLVEAHQVAG